MVEERPQRSPATSSRQSIWASIWTMVSGPRSWNASNTGIGTEFVAADDDRDRAPCEDRGNRLTNRGAVRSRVGLGAGEVAAIDRRDRRRGRSARRCRNRRAGGWPHSRRSHRGSPSAHRRNTARPIGTGSHRARRGWRSLLPSPRDRRRFGSPRKVSVSLAPNIAPISGRRVIACSGSASWHRDAGLRAARARHDGLCKLPRGPVVKAGPPAAVKAAPSP